MLEYSLNSDKRTKILFWERKSQVQLTDAGFVCRSFSLESQLLEKGPKMFDGEFKTPVYIY